MKNAVGIGLALISAVSATAQVSAQAPKTLVQRVQGVVTALSDTSFVIQTGNGPVTAVTLLPDRSVFVSAPIAISDIQPGSFVATANKSQPDGSGVSIEMRVFPPSSPPTFVNHVMSAADQAVMTNGRVAKAVSSDGGRLLTVDYGSGSRQIMVPSNIAAVLNTPGSWNMVKVGRKVTVATFPATPEQPARQFITIDRAELGS